MTIGGTAEQRSRGETESRARQFWCACLLVAALYCIVFQQLPLSYLSNASFDDAWYVSKALSIATGHWLGDYNQYALMKGAGYSLFLVLVSISGLPLAMAEALLLAGSLAVLCWNLARLSGSYRACAAVYAATLWHPILLTPRIVRDAIYFAELALVLAFMLQALFLAKGRGALVRAIILFGIAFAWFWLTREEGIWALPGLGLLAAVGLLRLGGDPARRKRCAVVLAGMALSAVLFIGLYGLINRIVYGSFELVDFKDSGFTAALDALYSVRVGERTPYVPAPKRVRLAVYDASPHFAELRAYLDGPVPSSWETEGCRQFPPSCGEIAGGWFFWAVRDAAAAAGKFRSPRAAQEFFSEVAKEIRGACASGSLECHSGPISGLPPLSPGQAWNALLRIRDALGFVLLLDHGTAALSMRPPPVSTGKQSDVDFVSIFLNTRGIAPTAEAVREYELSGWYMEKRHGWFRLSTRADDGNISDFATARQSSPDLVAAFHDPLAGNQRFRLTLQCREDCSISICPDDRVADPVDQIFSTDFQPSICTALSLKQPHGAFSVRVGDGEFYLDTITEVGVPVAYDPRPSIARSIQLAVAQPYGRFVPTALIAALAGLIAAICIPALRRRLTPSDVLLASIALIFDVLVVTRCALLGLIDALLFPAVHPMYLMPAYYLSLLGAGISFIVLGRLLMSLYRRRQSAPDPVPPPDPPARPVRGIGTDQGRVGLAWSETGWS